MRPLPLQLGGARELIAHFPIASLEGARPGWAEMNGSRSSPGVGSEEPPGFQPVHCSDPVIEVASSDDVATIRPGRAIQGPGVCFDVAPSGREVTRFEGGVVVRCFPGGVAPSEFEFTLTLTGSYPIGGHLGFSATGIALEGTTATAGFSGVIDPNGTATGTVSLGAMTLEHEGTKYSCQRGVGKWDAKRQT